MSDVPDHFLTDIDWKTAALKHCLCMWQKILAAFYAPKY